MKDQILNYLMKTPNEGKTPTDIGMELGKSYSRASSSVNGPLKSLIKEGKVIRYIDSSGRVKYKAKL